MSDSQDVAAYAERTMPAFQAVGQLWVYDLRGATRDVKISATTLAGLANRERPCCYVITEGDDEFWLQQVFAHLPQTRCAETGQQAFVAMVHEHRAKVQGLIVYDPALLDTLNVATTMAGQEDAIVVLPQQVAQLQEEHGLKVLRDLRIYGWTTRLQAYHWALKHLLPGAAKGIVAGLDPEQFCGLRSFLVATKAFVYWLDSRQSRLDLNQGLLSERQLMRQIVKSYPAGAIHMGWLVHEFSGVTMISRQGMSVVAVDFFLNLEVFSALQPQTPVEPVVRQPVVPEIKKKIYVSFVMSDGDNLQYCQHRMRQIWQERERGTVPIGWTVPPLLLEAAPAMAEYYMHSATPNDELICGPSGVGYIYPECMDESHLIPFVRKTGALMRRMGLTMLEVMDIDRLFRSNLPLLAKVCLTGMGLRQRKKQELFVRELAGYGVKGIFSGVGFWWGMGRWRRVVEMPLYHNVGMTDTVRRTVWLLKWLPRLLPRRPLFLNIYIIAWTMGPAALQEVVSQLGDEYEVVLPGTLLAMLSKNTDG